MASESKSMPTIPTAGGVGIPAVMFGTAFGNWTGDTEYQGFLPEQANRAITHALEAGYLSFDTAHAYATEGILGRLLAAKFADGSLTRDDVFIATKVAHPLAPPHVSISRRNCLEFRGDNLADRVQDQFELSLDTLGVGYVDLLLVHWPGAFNEKDGDFARAARKELWERVVAMKERGSARAIGVCNFSKRHLEELIEDTGVVPAVNQIEVHPYCYPADLVSFCKEKNIVIEAYAPFASGSFSLLKDEVLVKIAEETGKGVGQVVLRWHHQLGNVVLPKSSNPVRMAQNRDIFDFSLTDEQMAAISALGEGDIKRTCPAPDSVV